MRTIDKVIAEEFINNNHMRALTDNFSFIDLFINESNEEEDDDE